MARLPLGPCAALALSAAAAGCQDEPGRLCDRVRVVWPSLDLDAGDDVDPAAAGVQLDLALASNLEPGSTGVLTVTGADQPPSVHPDEAIVGADGDLRFAAVTVPLGRVELALRIVDPCGQANSVRTTFVWDGTGYPACELALGATPRPSEAHAPLGVLGAADDVDPDLAGIQLDVAVAAGRPDMAVALFVRAITDGTESVDVQVSGDDLTADFLATLPPGELSVRAVCTWVPEDLRPSSHTERFFVE